MAARSPFFVLNFVLCGALGKEQTINFRRREKSFVDGDGGRHEGFFLFWQDSMVEFPRHEGVDCLEVSDLPK